MNSIESIKTKFGAKVLGFNESKTKKAYFVINPEDILEFSTYIFKDLNLRFITVSGVDMRDSIEMLYHFSDDQSGAVITIRTMLTKKKDLVIDTLSKLIIGASWIEREIHEMLGVNFKGNDNLKHLLLNDDWPPNNYPLRHDNDNNN